MTRNRYLQIKQCLHVADNRNLAEGCIYFGELSLDTRYGVYAVTTGTNIILIFIAESPKDLEMNSV